MLERLKDFYALVDDFGPARANHVNVIRSTDGEATTIADQPQPTSTNPNQPRPGSGITQSKPLPMHCRAPPCTPILIKADTQQSQEPADGNDELGKRAIEGF